MLRIILSSFLVVMGSALFSGCSTVPSAQKIEPEIKTGEAATSSKQEPKSNEQPKSAIQPDLLYVLLMSEIAGQRGQLDLALDGYIKAMRFTQDAQVAERAAKIAWFAQKKEQSLEAINVWLQKEPASIEANRLKIGWFMANDDMEGALNQLDKLLLLPGVDSKQELVALVQRIGKLPNKEWALEFMGRIVERYKGRAEAHYARSLLAFRMNRPIIAVAEIKQAQKLKPDWVEAMILESQILVKQGKVAAADEVIKRALEIDAKNSKLRMLQAQLKLRSGDIEEAEELFRQLFKENPENYDALFALALLELKSGEVKSAKGKFERLVTNPKWGGQSSFYLGRITLKAGAYKEAISWFDQVVRGQFYFDAQMGAVEALAITSQIDEARQRLVSMREKFPKHQVRLYLVEGDLLREAKEYQLAYDLYSQAMKVKPEEIRFYYARSLVAEKMERLDLLEADLLHVLAVKPDDVNALNALGYTLSNRTERYEEAEVYLQRALELKPGDAAVMDSYGWLQFKKGEFEKALDFLRRAYDKNQDAEIAAHLGEVLWAVGKKPEAKKIWKEADEAHPDNEYLREIKERYREVF